MDIKVTSFALSLTFCFFITQAQDLTLPISGLLTPQIRTELQAAQKQVDYFETLKEKTQVEKDAALARIDSKEAKSNEAHKNRLDELKLRISGNSVDLDSLATRIEDLTKKIAVLGNVPEIEDERNLAKKDYQEKLHERQLAQTEASVCESKINTIHLQFDGDRNMVESEYNGKLQTIDRDLNDERAKVVNETQVLSGQLKKEEEVVRYKAMADKDDLSGLWRMSEIYREGYGVEVNLATADSYYNKYVNHLNGEAREQTKAEREKQLEYLKDKFKKNLALASRDNTPSALLYLEKCYRYGLGTEIDLKKANEYHDKALANGAFKQPNRW